MVAFLVRAVPVLVGGGLDGYLSYDDGVYFGAAIALIHGELPYRDVLLLHPPGMAVLLVPFALLGSMVGDATAFATARLAIMTLGALNAVLAGLVAGRYSRVAGLLAAGLYATWNVAAIGERSTDLHAPQHTLVLLALLVVSGPGRVRVAGAVAAGAALGLATSIQLWQGATLLVVLWWTWTRAVDGREVRTVVAGTAGAVASFTLVAGPFFALAPRTDGPPGHLRPARAAAHGRRDRGPSAGAGRWSRCVHRCPPGLRTLDPMPVVLAAALAGLALLLATAWRRPWTRPWVALASSRRRSCSRRRRSSPITGAFVAPATTVALATGFVMAGGWLVRHRIGPRFVVAGFVLLLVVLGAVSILPPRGRALPLVALREDLAAARCVAADAAGVAVLTGTLRRNAERGCPIVVDPTGVAYDTDRGRRYPTPRSWRIHAPGYQAAMEAWYTSVDAALFVRPRSNDRLEGRRGRDPGRAAGGHPPGDS